MLKVFRAKSHVSAIASIAGCLIAVSFALVPAAGAADKPQYMPPIAPTLDSSTNRPAPSAAAAADADSSLDQQIKGLLRQALEKHGQGDMAGAEKLFKQVLSLDPNNGDANYNLGAMAEERHDLQGALQYYRAAAHANPQDSDIHNALESVRDQLKQQQAGTQTAQELQHKQQLRKLGEDAAAAYKAGRFDQAITALQTIEAEQPNDPNVEFALGQAFHGKGDDVHAREFLARAVSLAPGNQLYAASLKDIDQQAQKQTGNGGGMPPARNLEDQIASDEQGWQSANSPSSDPSGIQPFTDQGLEKLPQGSSAYTGGLEQYGTGGLPPSMLPALGALSAGLGMGMMPGMMGMGTGMGMGMPMGTPMGMPMGFGSLFGGAMSPYGMSTPPIYSTPYYPNTNPYYHGYHGGWHRR